MLLATILSLLAMISPPLVRLIDGVDDAIVAAGIVDRDWRVPPERLDELAHRSLEWI